ncbi:MAG: outer membrane beta-barrel protein [Hyphomonas sp.]
MLKNIKLMTAIASAMIAAPVAAADDFQFSAGGEYIFDSADSEFAFTGITGRGAYFFNRNIGIEVEGTAGTSGASNYDGSGIDFDLDSQFGGYVVGRMPAGQSGEFFGRVGFRAGTISVSAFGVEETVDYNGFSIGGGYTYFFSENVGLRADVTTSGASLDNNFSPDGNLTSFAVSLVIKLGGKKEA